MVSSFSICHSQERSPFWNKSKSAIALDSFFSTKGDRLFGITQIVRRLGLQMGDRLPICYDTVELSCNKRSNTMMQITLSQAQSEVLETLVKQGQYPSLEEAINTALLLLIDDVALPDADRSPEYLVWVQATRKKIDMAREQAQNGEVLEANVVLAQLRAKVQSAKEAAV